MLTLRRYGTKCAKKWQFSFGENGEFNLDNSKNIKFVMLRRRYDQFLTKKGLENMR